MLSKLRPRSIYDVMAAIACFGVLAGGSAYAANTIGSADIVDNEVRSADVRDDTLSGGGLSNQDIANGAMTTNEIRDDTQGFGGLLSQDLAPGSVRSSEVQDNSLTSADVNESTLQGVNDGDACPAATLRFGDLCAGSDGAESTLPAAEQYCAGLGLRLPDSGEAVTLARNHDVPGVADDSSLFWTSDRNGLFEGDQALVTVSENGNSTADLWTQTNTRVCVTNPD